MYTYICIHIHTYVYIYMYVHTYIHTYIHACMHTYIRTYTYIEVAAWHASRCIASTPEPVQKNVSA